MLRLLFIALLLPVPAFAQVKPQLFTRDQCTPLYTVQKRGCVAEHVLRCETDDGVVFRNENVEDGELTDVYFSDFDFEFLDAWSSDGSEFVVEMVDNRDPFSLSNIRENGADVFDQTALVDMQIVEPREATIIGDARMTGETLEIEGAVLDEVQVRATMDLSTIEMWIEGRSYIDRETGTLFDGAYDVTVDGRVDEQPGEPVRILREGDRGFMLDITLFGCGEEG